MKRVSSFLMAFCIFLVIILTCSFTAFASGEFVFDFSSEAVLSYFTDTVVSGIFGSLSAKLEAARTYYFYKLLNNDYVYSGSLFTSDGTRFSEDYLSYCWQYYLNITLGHGIDEYDSKGDIFLSSAGWSNTPWSIKLIGFTFSSSISKDYYSDYSSYFQTYLARYILDQGGTATDPNPGKSGLDIAPGYVSSDDLKEQLDKENSMYSPKGKDLFYNSYRTDTYYHNSTLPMSYVMANQSNFNPFAITLYQNPQTKERLNDLYLLPFYKADDGTMYYCDYMFHLYFTDYEGISTDIGLRCDTYQYNRSLGYIYDDDNSGFVTSFMSSAMPYQLRANTFYFNYNSWASHTAVSVIKDELDYANYSESLYEFPFSEFSENFSYFTSSYENSIKFISYSGMSPSRDYPSVLKLFYNNVSYLSVENGMTYSANPNKNNDYGYICSNEMISTVYDIDSSKIPSGQIIQMTGDSNIYNYYITNPETGQSSTINEFVENNYYYITEGGVEGSGSSGGTGGDVNVDVDVDINVNVGGGGVNPGDFIEGDVNLGDYYDDAVDMASGVRSFMEKFFGFLPEDIIVLIGILIATAIVCRILGR